MNYEASITKKIGVSKKRLLKIIALVLPKNKTVPREVSLIFVSAIKMRSLNKTYRGQDMATNILTFKEGDIMLCPQVIKAEVKKYSFTQKYWMTRLIVHGILHLVGYNHDTRKNLLQMERLEQRVLDQLEILLNSKIKM